ncbi:Uncharacterised protein [Mycobacterium tuberculosis]|nr:Uncharacterised protein [Mycobacterium tuberculosis]CKW95791.1 Uncharacterised protein [Mycobacterium tuberculosis]COW58518.1 Uncharacterised protein [Mycobacterium tuberculosis]COZ21008.1 Uncharacterised protein [Mycobacterium tuberculosis]
MPSINRTSSGAASTDSVVAPSSRVVANVTKRRTNAAPPSGSSCSARASTGTKMAVKVASSTSAATRFGSWLATENELASAAPKIAASSTIRAKPVIRLISVANAIAQECDTSAASDSSGCLCDAVGTSPGEGLIPGAFRHPDWLRHGAAGRVCR